MSGNRTEACGRCSMSTVVDVASGYDDDAEGDSASGPFAGGRIEVDESEMRAVSPSAWLGGVTRWLDDAATAVTYDR